MPGREGLAAVKRAAQLQPPVRTRDDDDGVLVARSGPADQATEEAIERWLLSLLDSKTTPGEGQR